MRAFRQERGVALIEVLLAVLVLGGVGIFVVQFLTTGFLDGGGAEARAVAAQLAREKLDDLRQFSQLDSVPGTFGYADIGANTGGAKNADGSLRLPAGAIDVSGVTYQREWRVTALSFCAANATEPAATCGEPPLHADFKQIAVTLTWTDASGDPGSLTLETAIAAIEPALAAQALIPAAATAMPVFTPVPAPSAD